MLPTSKQLNICRHFYYSELVSKFDSAKLHHVPKISQLQDHEWGFKELQTLGMYESFAKAPPLLNQEWRLCGHNVEKYKFVRANTLQKEITNVHSEAFQIKSRYNWRGII